MPLMGWGAFSEAHHRPYVIIAELAAKGRQTPFETLQRLLRSTSLKGNYALHRGEAFIRVAIEAEADVLVIVRRLGVREVEGREEWAGRWEVTLDNPTLTRIRSMLQPLRRSPSLGRRRTPRQAPW
jgi:hypothetical protein